jgi:hypothetical protein
MKKRGNKAFESSTNNYNNNDDSISFNSDSFTTIMTNMKRSSSESLLLKQYQNERTDDFFPGLTKSSSMQQINDGLKTYIKNNNQITIFSEVPRLQMAPLHITNQNEAKKKFLQSNIPPVLKFKADSQRVKILIQNQSKARYDHFFKAKHILDMICEKYPRGVYAYYESNFGKKVNSEQCVKLVGKYLSRNQIDGEIKINFAPGLTCSGRILHYGMKNNRPETRKFVVWINKDKDNQFLREKGIVCLLDHELGTHYYRSFNDGLQVWFKNRGKYGLRQLQSRELASTEEGLAALNTLMSANLKYLYLPALLYCNLRTLLFFFNSRTSKPRVNKQRVEIMNRSV